MSLSITGHLSDERKVRVGFIGCGSHAFRNIYSSLQFLPVELKAVCDLDKTKADAFARQFGAEASYASADELLARDDIEAVLIVTDYDERGRPKYPQLACQALAAGKHAWMEKPPAANTADIEDMILAANKAGKNVAVGFKKMFAPSNEKAKQLIDELDFGGVGLATFQYPLRVPTPGELASYAGGECVESVVSFLDHLCHPASLMLSLLGMPQTLFYQVAANQAGAATFTFDSGAIATLALAQGVPAGEMYERTMLVSGASQQAVTIENNNHVTLHRSPATGYGVDPSYFSPPAEQTAHGGASLVWQPEFSLGQLYNKGIFLLGYWGELNEFFQSILAGRPVAKGTLQQAWQVTQIFEAFSEGPGKLIDIRPR